MKKRKKERKKTFRTIFRFIGISKEKNKERENKMNRYDDKL